MEQTTRTDMLTIAQTVAREKGIEIEQVIEALESAIQKAAASRYGLEFDIRAKINRDNGAVDLARYTEIVASEEEIENEMQQITLDGAKVSHPDLGVGEFIVDELPPIEFGRIAAQAAKQVIVQKVRDAERERQYENYKDRVGEIIAGTVKRVEYNNITIDLGMAEAVMMRDETIGRENLRRGDRVRAYLYDVRREQRGPQIFASRTHPDFLVALFKQEVPEIEEGTIEVIAVSRDPGSRAKICVKANETGMDPVGSCVGMRGSRVQQVVSELQGEKVDIIEYTESIETLVKKALQPAEVSQVIIDELTSKAEVVVEESQLSLAIGRRGQNVRLASQMLKLDLDIITEEEAQTRNEEKYKVRSEIFQNVLGVDDVMSRLLVQEGFTSIEDFAMIHIDELTEIEGVDEATATSLQTKAKDHIEKESKEVEKTIKELKVEQDLIDFIGGGVAIVNLAKNDVKNLEDLADLSADELQEFLAELGITEDEAANIIMQAREAAGWFDEVEAGETESEDA